MGLAAYDIIDNNAEWRVRHEGKAENVYQRSRFRSCGHCGLSRVATGHEVRGYRAGSRTREWIESLSGENG